jgi:hypothetical protein
LFFTAFFWFLYSEWNAFASAKGNAADYDFGKLSLVWVDEEPEQPARDTLSPKTKTEHLLVVKALAVFCAIAVAEAGVAYFTISSSITAYFTNGAMAWLNPAEWVAGADFLFEFLLEFVLAYAMAIVLAAAWAGVKSASKGPLDAKYLLVRGTLTASGLSAVVLFCSLISGASGFSHGLRSGLTFVLFNFLCLYAVAALLAAGLSVLLLAASVVGYFAFDLQKGGALAIDARLGVYKEGFKYLNYFVEWGKIRKLSYPVLFEANKVLQSMPTAHAPAISIPTGEKTLRIEDLSGVVYLPKVRDIEGFEEALRQLGKLEMLKRY